MLLVAHVEAAGDPPLHGLGQAPHFVVATTVASVTTCRRRPGVGWQARVTAVSDPPLLAAWGCANAGGAPVVHPRGRRRRGLPPPPPSLPRACPLGGGSLGAAPFPFLGTTRAAMVSWWQLSQGLSTSLATRLRRRRLEGFKFSVYVLLPIGASYFFGSGAYPYLERIIQQVRFRAFSSSLGFFFFFLLSFFLFPPLRPWFVPPPLLNPFAATTCVAALARPMYCCMQPWLHLSTTCACLLTRPPFRSYGPSALASHSPLFAPLLGLSILSGSQRSYVVYPPEGPAPPKPNEMSRLVERERELYEARRGASGVSDAVQRPPFDARPQP